MQYLIAETLNASLANLDLLAGGAGISPTSFDAGGFSFTQSMMNLDVTRYFADALEGINVAFGAETRTKLTKSALASAAPGMTTTATARQPPAARAFLDSDQRIGLTEAAARASAYVDVKRSSRTNFCLPPRLASSTTATSGDAQIGKLASSYKINDSLRLRGSVSGGFRAPSLQQQYFSSTITNFVQGAPLDIVVAPNGSPIALAAGVSGPARGKIAKRLRIGFAYAASSNSLSHARRLSGRCAGSHRSHQGINTTDLMSPATEPLRAVLDSLNVARAQFLVNAVDTRTKGVDLSVNHTTPLACRYVIYTSEARTTTRTRSRGEPNVRAARTGHRRVPVTARTLVHRRRGPEIESNSEHQLHTRTLGCDRETDALRLAHARRVLRRDGIRSTLPTAHLGRHEHQLRPGWHVETHAGRNANIFDAMPSPQNPNETDTNFTYESVQMGFNGSAWFARLSGTIR